MIVGVKLNPTSHKIIALDTLRLENGATGFLVDVGDEIFEGVIENLVLFLFAVAHHGAGQLTAGLVLRVAIEAPAFPFDAEDHMVSLHFAVDLPQRLEHDRQRHTGLGEGIALHDVAGAIEHVGDVNDRVSGHGNISLTISTHHIGTVRRRQFSFTKLLGSGAFNALGHNELDHQFVTIRADLEIRPKAETFQLGQSAHGHGTEDVEGAFTAGGFVVVDRVVSVSEVHSKLSDNVPDQGLDMALAVATGIHFIGLVCPFRLD